MVPQQQRRRRRRAALSRTGERRVVVARGAGGFGFTIAGQRPCVVSAVAVGGPADRAGLRAGDALLAVDGASVARAPHASVARLVAAAPGAIALSVAPREAPPTDTEDTEPDERARTRRRHPPPRRRQQPALHHPACHAVPSTSGVNEILQNLSRAQLTPSYAARLECRAVVGYLGTIETPQASPSAAPGNVRTAVRKLRQERRPATPVLLSVLPNVLLLRRPTGQVLAEYPRERIVFAGCGSEADRRYFGLVTSAEMPDAGASHSCHVFAVDPRMAEHDAHVGRAREFQIVCTRDPVAERCLEFPPSAEYVVGVVRGMYSLPPDDGSPGLQQISKLAVKGDSPALGNFSRCSRGVFRVPRDRRGCRHEDGRMDGQEFVANSPQPSNHSEITTTSSNSDSGIGFHNDCRNIADRILVVDFVGQQPPPNRFRQEMPRRPMGLVGCSSFDADGSFLSNTTPVVDGFGGQGRPLNLDDVILNANDLQPVRRMSPRIEDDTYNYNNLYGNLPSTSRNYNGVVHDQAYNENEGHYGLVPSQLNIDLEMDRVTEAFNSVEIYEERRQPPDYQSNESVENVTVISGGTSKASMDSVSVYSSRSHEEARPSRRKHLQASLDDMLVLGLHDQQPTRDKDEGTFLHPSSIKYKVRKSIKPLNILSKTRHMLMGKSGKEERRRAMSASAGDVTPADGADGLPAAASEPDLRDTQSEQSSPFRRWTTGSGAGSSYRHADHRTLFAKQQMSEGVDGNSIRGSQQGQWPNGGVARWSLGLEHLLADPAGYAAFAAFLDKEFSHENIQFWHECERYSSTEDPHERATLAKEIWDRHLGDNAPEPVNVDSGSRRATLSRMSEEPAPSDLFTTEERPPHPVEPVVAVNCSCDRIQGPHTHVGSQYALNCFPEVQRQIFNVMKFDSYPRFLRSAVHAECARADLRGQPSPYKSSTEQAPRSRREATPGASSSMAGPSVNAGPSDDIEVLATPIKKPARRIFYHSSGFDDDDLYEDDIYGNVFIGRRLGELLTRINNPEFAKRPGFPRVDGCWASGEDLYPPPPQEEEKETSMTFCQKLFDFCLWICCVPFSAYDKCCRECKARSESTIDDLELTSLRTRPPRRREYNEELKKSTSNAERRRNGAPSSLLFKLRVQSRDRATQSNGGGSDETAAHAPPIAAAAAPANAAPVALTDVVKSGALCRVVLPDGATSVVEVDPELPVRRLVDKLLQRRNLLVVNYDVLLKEAHQNDPSVIDTNAPSTILGGREVVVERRCVVRMEVGGRCVAVRCRGARRLRHILRPVLARYTATPQAPRIVLHGDTPLHPDTPMQELDGARLQIVDLNEAGEHQRDRGNRDDDGDSYSDVAVRIYDDGRDDSLSVSGRSGRSEPGACAGRVRAALRPGPPLHHHPPDFLENLRETQRQRLQNKNEPVPAPRTPPPLPPKPSSRPPTLV